MSSKKVTKKEKRRLFLITVTTLGIIALIFINIFTVWSQILNMKNEKDVLTEHLSKLQDEEMYLKTEVEKLQNPHYIARYAREKYLFSRDGEFNIRIQD